MNRRWFIAVVAAAAIATGIGAGSAMAGTDSIDAASDCPSTYLCVWWDSGFGNPRYQFAGNNTSWHAWAIADDDSSWYNHGTSGLRVQVYRDVNYVSTTICVAHSQQVSFNSFANDKGSSNKWGGC
jgi:peptidase inhibitor family I36